MNASTAPKDRRVHPPDAFHRSNGRSVAMAIRLFVGALLVAVIPTLLVMWEGRRPSYVLSDSAWVADEEPYLGLVSNLGLLLWASAVAMALFAAWMLSDRQDRRDSVAFALAVGTLSAVFLADDLIQFHEALATRIHTSAEPVVVLIYAVMTAAFVSRFRKELTSEIVLASLAGAFLALSAVADLALTSLAENLGLPTLLVRGTHSFEDVAKFIGIAFWASAVAHMMRREILDATAG